MLLPNCLSETTLLEVLLAMQVVFYFLLRKGAINGKQHNHSGGYEPAFQRGETAVIGATGWSPTRTFRQDYLDVGLRPENRSDQTPLGNGSHRL